MTNHSKPSSNDSSGGGTPTPRTDAEAFSDSLVPELKNVPAEFARQLERELSAAQSALAEKEREGWMPGRRHKLPEEIQEWCWHMDLHLTEHDERHAGLALRAAWPHVSKWLKENVVSSFEGKAFAAAPSAGGEGK